jgi:PKD repeat protein
MQVLPTFYANFNHTPNTCGSTKVAFANTSLWDSTYTWYFGDGTTSNEKNPTHTYPTAGKYKVTLSINNGKSFKTKEIYVAANPTTNGIQSQLQSCGNLYIFSTAALGQNLSYFWSFSGGYGSLENSPAVGRLFGDTSAQVVNLTVASDGRCFTVVPSLLIQPLPSIESGIVADFSTQMIQEGLCKTGIQFTNSSTNATQYKWVFGDGAVSPIVSKLNTFHAYPTAGVYQVSLIAINKQGCSDTLTKMLTVTAGGYATPVSDFSTDYPIQCISDHRFDFVNNSSLTGFGWVPKFYWDFGDGTFDRENTFTYGKKFKGPGDYLITLVAESNYGCRDTTSKWIKVVPNSECTPLMMREKNDGQLGNSDITYLGQSQTTGTASVRKENATISLFPNPNNGSFTLLSTLNIEQGTTFQIIDILGREAFATQSFQVSSNERKFIFEDLSQGTYLMLISLPSGQTQRLTFVISR